LVDAMAVYVRLYHLAPDGAYEVSFNFDDSIVVDKDTELLAMQQDVVQGLLRPEIYIAKKYGVSEEEALKMMPEKVKMDENGDFIDEESNDFANDKNEPNKADNSRNDGGDG
ncbi:MAG: hypothetical protein PHN26_09415, partial [Eubacteriaceae bacterium]|nr:hypothetical protein [Eubacteriaceae bacterium]